MSATPLLFAIETSTATPLPLAEFASGGATGESSGPAGSEINYTNNELLEVKYLRLRQRGDFQVNLGTSTLKPKPFAIILRIYIDSALS